jgi:ferredoxin
MRLDLFLPALRKPKPGAPARRRPLTRFAQRLLPAAWFSNPETKQRGSIRRFLRWLGPTWLSSPVRRLAQAFCFVLFLYLFFYVCYPYHARPAGVWRGWQPTAIAANDEITLTSDSPTDGSSQGALRSGRLLYAAVSDVTGEPTEMGPVNVVSHQPVSRGKENASSLIVRPTKNFPPERLEELRFDLGGPWTLSEQPAGAWPAHYTASLARKEVIHAESLLIIDPLVAISTAIASRTWVWSLVFAGLILLAAVLVPRGFCGYICPLGTLIDLFDWAIAGRVKRFHVPDNGWWVHVKYYLLAGVLLCSTFGVLVSGYVAAIPVITRGMLFLFEPLQTASARGWHNVPPLNAGHFVSLALFFAVLGLGFFRPRFWCKYVCPSGAVFSLGNLFRATERKVENTCIHCNKCIEICPFDAIKPDFTTRTTDCTLCQTCGGVCPTHAIKFVDRLNLVQLKMENDPPTGEGPLGRRGFLSLAAGTAAAAVGAGALTVATKLYGADLAGGSRLLPVRPPGSLPEREFLAACIRCGECFKACPNNVLQPLAFQQGLEGLWTPAVQADWAGCESSCNACTQVCPTGAIRALPLEEKRVARMGLAIVDPTTCLPLAGRQECDLCVKECQDAGYHAIEFTRVGTQADADGQPIEGTGFLAPVVLADRCVGCGLCQTRCFGGHVMGTGLLERSAIVIEAGPGKEDRLLSGSYLALREQEAADRRREQAERAKKAGGYLPDFLQ